MNTDLVQKYNNLNNQLLIIKKQINILLDKDNNLKNVLKEFALIDSDIIEQDKINNIQNDNIQIYNELENKIIPNITNKIY